jgi:hypothetical protein
LTSEIGVISFGLYLMNDTLLVPAHHLLFFEIYLLLAASPPFGSGGFGIQALVIEAT